MRAHKVPRTTAFERWGRKGGERPDAAAHDTVAAIRSANHLRSLLGKLYVGTPSNFVFAPGLAIGGLWPLFSRLKVEHVILSDHDYYGKHSFPLVSEVSVIDSLTERTSLEAAIDAALQDSRSTCALIMSVVSCQGVPLPVDSTFSNLRRRLGPDCPVLIADYSHAGAIGYPPISELGADVVCGDPAKWILPGDDEADSKLRFLYLHSADVRDLVKPVFESVLLASDEAALEKGWLSSGVSTSHVLRLVRALEDRADHRPISRMSDQDLATKLANALQLPVPRSALLVLDERAQRRLAHLVGAVHMRALLADRLLREDPFCDRFRLLCRADRFDALRVRLQ